MTYTRRASKPVSFRKVDSLSTFARSLVSSSSVTSDLISDMRMTSGWSFDCSLSLTGHTCLSKLCRSTGSEHASQGAFPGQPGLPSGLLDLSSAACGWPPVRLERSPQVEDG